MKKHILRGGLIFATPLLVFLLLHYLTPGEENIFTILTTLATLPMSILPSFLPKFGIVGVGDVFGFAYLSEVISAIVYYFILGMLVGWGVCKLKARKSNVAV